MDRDMLFVFAHGIRMALESLGIPFDDPDALLPILQRMDAILGSAKHSLIKGDDSVTDWDQFRRLRKIEQQLCTAYLMEVNGNPANEGTGEGLRLNPDLDLEENDGQPS